MHGVVLPVDGLPPPSGGRGNDVLLIFKKPLDRDPLVFWGPKKKRLCLGAFPKRAPKCFPLSCLGGIEFQKHLPGTVVAARKSGGGKNN